MAEQAKTPLDLLGEQTALLAKIQEEIKLLRADQLRIALDNEEAVEETSPANVSIINFNMPFMALVRFLVKIALASIPAALVLGGIYLVGLFILTRLLLLR